MIALDSVLHRRPDVRYRLVVDEGVIVRQSSMEILVLNDVGARVFDLLEGRSVSALLHAMSEEYDVERSVLEEDIMGYLQELASAGVIDASSER